MSICISGVDKNGVVVPDVLPENAIVEIRLDDQPMNVRAAQLTPAELRRMPREQRQAVLSGAAAMAEEDYRCDKELTGLEAFSAEEQENSR
jgi:hypothetical protein